MIKKLLYSFWRTCGSFLVLGTVFLLVIFLILTEKHTVSELLNRFAAELTSQDLIGIGLWGTIFFLLEALLTANKMSWIFFKVLWTGAILLFYGIVLLSNYQDWHGLSFLPMGIYLLRVLVPYSWVLAWKNIFVKTNEQDTNIRELLC